MRASGGFESTQRVLASGPVVESSESGARWLGIAYWQAVNQFTRGGVRARWTDDGGRLTLLGGASLLSFGAPELAFSGNAVSCRYTIQGGLLALRAGGSSHSRSVAPTAKWSSASPSRSIFRASRRGSARPGGRERSTRTDRARCTLPSVAATSSYSPRGQACEGHGLWRDRSRRERTSPAPRGRPRAGRRLALRARNRARRPLGRGRRELRR